MKERTVVFLVLVFLFVSCTEDGGNLKINSFNKVQTIELQPYGNYPYTTMNIWIEGYTNDTIHIKLDNIENKPILKLSEK